jgi:SAM-dependent methyltransferase
MKTKNDYATMQKQWYEREADLMNSTGNHRHHDRNPDYKNLLLRQLKENPDKFQGGFALDFGCGQGRNVSNMILWYPGLFQRADGVDISAGNVEYCEKNLAREVGDSSKYKFFVNNGLDLQELESEFYSFVMSTIVFQHICVHETRYSLMSEIFRVLKPGGVFSFQMGFGYGNNRTADYFENIYDATGTNSFHDVRIVDEKDLVGDLQKIGFSPVTYTISHPDHDAHPNWIFVEATKPS